MLHALGQVLIGSIYALGIASLGLVAQDSMRTQKEGGEKITITKKAAKPKKSPPASKPKEQKATESPKVAS